MYMRNLSNQASCGEARAAIKADLFDKNWRYEIKEIEPLPLLQLPKSDDYKKSLSNAITNIDDLLVTPPPKEANILLTPEFKS